MQVIQQASFWKRFDQMPLVGICRNTGLEEMMQLLPVYRDAGLTTIEITMNTPGATAIIHEAVTAFGTELNIGAGTVCSMEDLEMAIAAGARFIVTPIVQEEIIASCRERGIPVFAGAFTPTEIFHAWNTGADVVKIFPASTITPAFIRDLKGPFPQIRVLPTGGVSLENCSDFIKAGAVGVGIGGQLIDKHLLQTKNWKALSEHFRAFAKRISAAIGLSAGNTASGQTTTHLDPVLLSNGQR
jgi:2-dehydro-3-deoxyphosphogluconate aldolase/(4S)-4-hydroxy-2-oxoglutarate aldolase